MKTTAARLWSVSGVTARAAMVAALVITAGCDSSSFLPPQPAELKQPAKPGSAAASDGASNAAAFRFPDAGKPGGRRVQVVELILAGPPDDDRVLFEIVLRHELAKVRIPLRLTQSDPQKRSSPEGLAGAIRAAAGRGVAALVVEPSEEAVVVDALYDAISRGVAVLLLDRPVPVRGGKSIPWVEYTGFADVGRQIVAAVLEANRKLEPARPGRVLFLHHRAGDPYLERAFQSLLEPAQAAGKPLELLEFDGNAEQGMAVLRKSLEADPEIAIFLADDAVGVQVGFRIHANRIRTGRPGFLLAGYLSNDYRYVTFLDLMYAIGDRSVGSYASTSCQAILSLMGAKPVGDVVRVPVTFEQRATEPGPTPRKPLPQEKTRSPRG
jgi:ABC-type sugar transport system substrate-binding protein